jgi:hypothetical protein
LYKKSTFLSTFRSPCTSNRSETFTKFVLVKKQAFLRVRSVVWLFYSYQKRYEETKKYSARSIERSISEHERPICHKGDTNRELRNWHNFCFTHQDPSVLEFSKSSDDPFYGNPGKRKAVYHQTLSIYVYLFDKLRHWVSLDENRTVSMNSYFLETEFNLEICE